MRHNPSVYFCDEHNKLIKTFFDVSLSSFAIPHKDEIVTITNDTDKVGTFKVTNIEYTYNDYIDDDFFTSHVTIYLKNINYEIFRN